MKLRTWLRPGMLVKRWIILLLLGLISTSLAMAMGLAYLYRNFAFPSATTGLVQALTLQFIPHPWREILVLVLGQVSPSCSTLLQVFVAPQAARPASRWSGSGGYHRDSPFRDVEEPDLRVVTIGGGTGLGTMLRGLKQPQLAITAIVTVADDGGSSGRLREEFGVLPPGDIRNSWSRWRIPRR